VRPRPGHRARSAFRCSRRACLKRLRPPLRHQPEVGAACGNAARTDLCGGGRPLGRSLPRPPRSISVILFDLPVTSNEWPSGIRCVGVSDLSTRGCRFGHGVAMLPRCFAKRRRARARAFSASIWRSRGGEVVDSESISVRATAATSSTARVNAAAWDSVESLYKTRSASNPEEQSTERREDTNPRIIHMNPPCPTWV
jgi:hypothetical protein